MLPPDFTAGTLRLSAAHTPSGAVAVQWQGRSELREPHVHLLPFFEEVIRSARASGQQLQLRFDQIEYFNSSTVAFVIGLISRARELKVGTEIVYDESLRWQSVSFEALRRAMKLFEKDAESPVRFVGSGAGAFGAAVA